MKLSGSEKLRLMKRDYSLKNKVLHLLFSPTVPSALFFFSFPTPLPFLKKTHAFLILSTLTVHCDKVREANADGYIMYL